jgi:hypothetical protein
MGVTVRDLNFGNRIIDRVQLFEFYNDTQQQIYIGKTDMVYLSVQDNKNSLTFFKVYFVAYGGYERLFESNLSPTIDVDLYSLDGNSFYVTVSSNPSPSSVKVEARIFTNSNY